MTDQEIMQLAKEAGFSAGVRHIEDDVIHFAKLVAEREREACAKISEGMARLTAAEMRLEVQDAIAHTIRARGEKGGAEC